MAFINQYDQPEYGMKLSMKDYVLVKMKYFLDTDEYDDIDYVFSEVWYQSAFNIMSKDDILENIYCRIESYGWLNSIEKPKLDMVILLMLEYLELTGEFRWNFSLN